MSTLSLARAGIVEPQVQHWYEACLEITEKTKTLAYEGPWMENGQPAPGPLAHWLDKVGPIPQLPPVELTRKLSPEIRLIGPTGYPYSAELLVKCSASIRCVRGKHLIYSANWSIDDQHGFAVEFYSPQRIIHYCHQKMTESLQRLTILQQKSAARAHQDAIHTIEMSEWLHRISPENKTTT